jgi:hypothetical protein
VKIPRVVQAEATGAGYVRIQHMVNGGWRVAAVLFPREARELAQELEAAADRASREAAKPVEDDE